LNNKFAGQCCRRPVGSTVRMFVLCQWLTQRDGCDVLLRTEMFWNVTSVFPDVSEERFTFFFSCTFLPLSVPPETSGDPTLTSESHSDGAES
jgi:hypothetical protein